MARPRKEADFDRRDELREALVFYRRREVMDLPEQEGAIDRLSRHRLWSMSQIGSIIGRTRAFVARRMDKSDMTGGKFNPQTIPDLLELIELKDRGEEPAELMRKISDAGTSGYMISRLTGIPLSTVTYKIKRG